MKLQQLEYVLAIVENGNHLSAAANALHTSQPGVSRQLQMLESELGIEIFERTRNRIVGLTEPGMRFVEVARRIMGDVESLVSLREDFMLAEKGQLTIATTHTSANYVLPKVLGPYLAAYPGVQVVLLQGDPESICEMVESGKADLALGTEPPQAFPDLVQLPCRELPRVIVAPSGHPILDAEELTLELIAGYPILGYDTRFSGHWRVRDAFERAGIPFHVALTAIDAGVCKTYVRMGMGIAILTAVSYDPETDIGLQSRDASHLFASSTVCVTLRPNIYPRGYLLGFIKRFAPQHTPEKVRAALLRHPER